MRYDDRALHDSRNRVQVDNDFIAVLPAAVGPAAPSVKSLSNLSPATKPRLPGNSSSQRTRLLS